jgi:hypothetical protein
MKNQFGKKLLVGSVIAALSGGAQAAAPTLGEVLKSTGLDVTGYVDVSYSHLSTDTGTTNYRAYDTEASSFSLHALDLALAYLPSSGAGAFAELQFGTDAQFNRAAEVTDRTAANVLQGYVQYATGPVTVIGGKFATLAGAEVPQAPNNTNFSRSLLYTLAIPVTHTGVRGSYALGDTMKFTAGVNNGWDALQDSASGNARGKTTELGASFTPIKPLSVAASMYSGDELSSASGNIGKRQLIDVVVTYTLSDAMSVVVNVDQGQQERASSTGGKAKWSGVAGYFNYKVNDTWRVSVRGEQFDDKTCFRASCGTDTSQKLAEVTGTVGYSPAKNAELRAEVRQDKSNKSVFTESGQAENQTSFGLEAVYKF